jgi:hypothetical protein
MLCEVARRKKNTFIGRVVRGWPDLSLRRLWQEMCAVTGKASYGGARAPLTGSRIDVHCFELEKAPVVIRICNAILAFNVL